MNAKDIIQLISQTGGFGAVVLFAVFGFKGYIRWGREVINVEKQLEVMRQERDDWRELALRGTSLAEALTNVQQRRIFSGNKK